MVAEIWPVWLYQLFPIFRNSSQLMRILCLLVLSCAFSFIALSQIQPGKNDNAIIDGYAHPAFVQRLHAAANKIIIDEQQPFYLASVTDPAIFVHPRNFVVVRQLSPTHAIVRINSNTDAARLFAYLLPANNAWKASPGLLKNKNNAGQLILAVRDVAAFKAQFSNQLQVIQEYTNINAVAVRLNNYSVIDALLASDQVLFADMAARTPKEELVVSGFDLGANYGNTAHHHFPNVTGEGLMVSVKENGFDTADIDLKGRVVNSGIASANTSGHATIMATMMAGAGNSYYEGKGYAWKASLQSATFANLMPEPDSYYNAQRISVQNHSYGTGIENFYGTDAAAYDATVITNPVLLHVFSSGNSGLAASSGPYAGITGFANLTGSFKMAKNNLVVGAIDSVGNIEGPSSKGPAYDGRIKPELVAFGQDGSSGSAAIVSGIALLAQHAYQQQHGTLPPAALVKAMLINTADDVGAKGPDFASGYGNANAYQCLRALDRSQFFTNSIQQGAAQTFNLAIPSNIRTLKLTLVWTDPAATANTAKALVNDLDLELVHVASGESWQPWVLSRFPHLDSLKLPAVRGTDTLNNVEQISVDLPAAGDYLIRVKGSRVTNAQPYFIAYGANELDRFEWMYPMMRDPVQAATGVLLRWQADVSSGTTGQLKYSLDGINWPVISNNIDLSKNYFRWIAPDTFSTAQLVMTIGGNSFLTDTFVISKPLATQVGFNCADSFLFYWNRPTGVSSFQVYKLGSRFLEPVTVTSDTFYLGAKSTAGSNHFTVAPVVNDRNGIKAYTFNYTSQGVGCYFRTFLAQLNANKVDLLLELASLYRVQKLTVQKLSGNTVTDIQSINNPNLLEYTFIDPAPQQGVNSYRVALQLADGRIIYSSTEVVYYLINTDYLIYPNPVRAGRTFRVQQKEPADIRILLYDAAGRMVKNGTYADLVNPVNIAGLQKGLYVVVVEKEGVRVFRGKLIIN
jgi:hypothetical protein